ncbi:MAG: Gfo/Idh/MocA family protein [Pirellulaceae bacterium]
MPARYTRRKFIGKTTALAALAAGSQLFPAPNILAEASPNSKLNIAGIGVGGRGGSHVQASLTENLVAACDASQGPLDGCLRRVEKHHKEHGINRPLPKAFSDYREMFDKMHKSIDAVFVATPDNHHAPASMRAIKLDKHVYCEKPLTLRIDEARQLTLAAREHKVATQMGNQGRASEAWRVLAEMIWDGAIGNVKEVHVWTDRPGIPKRFWWPQGGTRPSGSDPVPSSLHWNEWLGPAPERPYLATYKEGKFQGKRVYEPFVWRGWWDFGTGALGDIGCHAISGTFTALKIEPANAVELIKDSGDTTEEMFPRASIIRWDVPARSDMPPCQLFWYDGGLYPPPEVGEIADGREYPTNGTVIVGDAGKMTFYGGPRLLPESRMKEYKKPEPVIPRCESDHFQEWVTACKGGRPAFSNFDHAGPLTEFVLLGNLAIRAGAGQKLEWDAANMKCAHCEEANALVRREYRRGWEL